MEADGPRASIDFRPLSRVESPVPPPIATTRKPGRRVLRRKPPEACDPSWGGLAILFGNGSGGSRRPDQDREVL